MRTISLHVESWSSYFWLLHSLCLYWLFVCALSLLERHSRFHDPLGHVVLRRHHCGNPLLRPLFRLREVQSLLRCWHHVLCFKWVLAVAMRFWCEMFRRTLQGNLWCVLSSSLLPSTNQRSSFCSRWPSTLGSPSTSWASVSVTGASPGPTYSAGWLCSWPSLQVKSLQGKRSAKFCNFGPFAQNWFGGSVIHSIFNNWIPWGPPWLLSS